MTHDKALEAAARALCDPDKCVAANEPDRGRCTAENCNSVIAAQKAITAYLSAISGEHGDLVKRLRGHSCGCGGACGQQTPAFISEAAAALSAADAEIERLRFQLEIESDAANNYCEVCGSCGSEGCGCESKCKFALSHPDAIKVVDDLTSRAEAAEAKVADLLGAIGPFANMLPDSQEPKDALQRKLQEWCHRARAAAIRAREE